ncbi:putative Pentatricopeptide repeat-containing protein [Cocos nucifera]|uniref:Putative Pentatricopeptide repeat-containing protein n=1 Tax=Cocos nucifera TaxID=13894 RepID=A0A8K0HUB7_COCNU|nr:putative Pentatricopeptide repeat-containing protein [Cocos nucifera]
MDVAQDLFDKMHEMDSVSWNVLISGYAQNGESDKALSVFSQMLVAGIKPDNATLLTVMSACSSVCSVESKVVDRIASFAKSVNSVSVSTALLNLYAKVGRMQEAREVFDAIPEKDLVAWNAMIAGYAQNQRPPEAIELFRLMQKSRNGVKIRPDGVTMISLIDSCSQMGALSLGEWVYAYIRKNRIEADTVLMTAIVDMYAKCGDLDRARCLFAEMPEKDLASWNAMIID